MVHALIKEIKEEKLPDPDDEFASGVGEGFASIDSLMERLRGDIRERLEAEETGAYQEAALTALTENAEAMEFPPIMVDREIDRFLNEQARNTGMELDKYLELIRKTPQEVREELMPSATERVKRSLALSQLAEAETIEVEEGEIDAEIERLIAQASAGNSEQAERYRQIFRPADARASLRRTLLTRKTVERLVEIASQADGAKPKKSKSKAAPGEPAGEPEAEPTPGEEQATE
jgi:trigger factor